MEKKDFNFCSYYMQFLNHQKKDISAVKENILFRIIIIFVQLFCIIVNTGILLIIANRIIVNTFISNARLK